jgi:hypothetical protein
MADLGDDAAALPKITQEQPDAAEIQVAPEDGADPLGLFPSPRFSNSSMCVRRRG